MAESQERVLLRWFEEIWNQGRTETISELLDPECIIHDGPTSLKGPEEFRQFYDRIHANFSHIRLTPHEVVSAGDVACLRWSSTMVPRAGGPGNPVHITGMSMARFSNGRIREAWQNWDMLGLMEQLGQAPASDMYMGSREPRKGLAAE